MKSVYLAGNHSLVFQSVHQGQSGNKQVSRPSNSGICYRRRYALSNVAAEPRLWVISSRLKKKFLKSSIILTLILRVHSVFTSVRWAVSDLHVLNDNHIRNGNKEIEKNLENWDPDKL